MVRTCRPRFFKVFFPDLSSERLKIPMGFLKHMEGKTSGCVTLKGPSGYIWNVELIQNSNGLFLQDGWPVFLSDHSVDIGDFFVFRYDGSLHFTVHIFDPSACEKEAALSAKCSQDTKDFIRNKGKKRGRGKEVEILDASSKRVRENSLQIHSEHVSKNGEAKAHNFDKNGCKQVDLFASEAQKESILSNRRKRHGRSFSSSQSNELPENKIQRVTCRRINKKEIYQSIRELDFPARVSEKCSRTIEERVAKSFTTNCPYFVRFIRDYSVRGCCNLSIPTWFCMEHFPRFKTEVALWDTNGKSWVVNAVPDASLKKYSFCRGWTAFIRDNNIKKADICIFELVGKLEMRVHIFLGRKIFDQPSKNSAGFARLSRSIAWKDQTGIEVLTWESLQILKCKHQKGNYDRKLTCFSLKQD